VPYGIAAAVIGFINKPLQLNAIRCVLSMQAIFISKFLHILGTFQIHGSRATGEFEMLRKQPQLEERRVLLELTLLKEDRSRT